VLKPKPQCGLLYPVEDRGAQIFVGYTQVHQRIDAVSFRKQRKAKFAGDAGRLVLFVDGIVKDDDVMVFVNNFVIADDRHPSATLLGPLRRRAEHLAGCNSILNPIGAHHAQLPRLAQDACSLLLKPAP
jgi:hypothetical protein